MIILSRILKIFEEQIGRDEKKGHEPFDEDELEYPTNTLQILIARKTDTKKSKTCLKKIRIVD